MGFVTSISVRREAEAMAAVEALLAATVAAELKDVVRQAIKGVVQARTQRTRGANVYETLAHGLLHRVVSYEASQVLSEACRELADEYVAARGLERVWDSLVGEVVEHEVGVVVEDARLGLALDKVIEDAAAPLIHEVWAS